MLGYGLKLGSHGGSIDRTPAAPVSTNAPSISGDTDVGDTLSTSNGSWSGFPRPTYTYQWQRDDGGFANISGATNQTYTLQVADDGHDVRCVVTATNSEGSASANSNAVSVVDVSAPSNSVAPALSGTPTIGDELTCSTGTWTGVPTPTYTYQWQLDTGSGFTDISGETTSAYTPLLANENDDIRCVVTATNSEGSATANSNSATIVDVVSLSSLFASRTIGGYWDIQDIASMYQEHTATTPAAVGSPVGYITDKSGLDRHLTQDVSASRPTLRQTAGGLYYLEFDGVDDFLEVHPANMISKTMLFAMAVDIDTSDNIGMIAGHPTLTAFYGMYQSGSASTAASTAFYDDNSLIYSNPTRNEFFIGVSGGLMPLMFETPIVGNNWPVSWMHTPPYGGLYACKGDVYRIALLDTATSDERATINTWLKQGAGL